MIDWILQPWPWYVGGPLIGLTVPALLLAGGKCFGVSDNYRTICAALVPGRVQFFKYNWREAGTWNLLFACGIMIGGAIGTFVLNDGSNVAISASTVSDLSALGIKDFTGLVPSDLFTWSALWSPVGFVSLVVGGFLVGFGSRYAGGCTSGHGVSGLADLQVASLTAVIGFFIGGLFITHVILPLLF